MVPFDRTALVGVLVALVGGLAIGIERQWSGKAAGPSARFAGVRTFTLLGLLAGLCGWLWTAGLEGLASVLLAGVGALIVVAYLAASRTDVDGTTEVAAFVVLIAGVLAGAGSSRVSSAVVALTLLLLVEKKRLHGLVSKIDRTEVRGGARFAVMAAVVLPLLPEGPYGPLGGIRPRVLWALVLFFSGLSFVGYVARRVVGGERGYVLAGALGGLLTSTSVTLTFARLSATRRSARAALAAGTLGANLVLFPRVLAACVVIAPPLAQALWPAFVAPLLVGALLAIRGLRSRSERHHVTAEKNPLQFVAAVQMAALFQIVLFGVYFADAFFGQAGVYGSAVVLGLTDMDALTLSMAQLVTKGTAVDVAARAVTIGALSNTLVKLGLTIVIGRGEFRVLAGAGLAMMAVALAAAAWMR
jgi:uncharacterized membrane protein (DUF4010 family)